MKTIFADTFFYLALVSRDDAAHRRVVDFCRASSVQTVTTAWVLTEVADALAAPRQRRVFLALFERLQADPTVTIVAPTQAWFEQGVALYASRLDKEWSITDCISFAVMRERDLTDALTADRHFEQAGFTRLLK
ncbi:MAG: type II toxin-antitoxin system VapC family toxin [Pirellulales bacterium]